MTTVTLQTKCDPTLPSAWVSKSCISTGNIFWFWNLFRRGQPLAGRSAPTAKLPTDHVDVVYHDVIAGSRESRGHHYDTPFIYRILKSIIYNPNKPNKLQVYASIKKTFSLENYVSCYNIAKRISSHHLAIEKGRYTRPITPREQCFCFCNNCSEKVIGDEMHLLPGCPKSVSEGGRLFYDLDQLYDIRNNVDFLTFNLLMNYGFGDTHMAGKILKYINECFNT